MNFKDSDLKTNAASIEKLTLNNQELGKKELFLKNLMSNKQTPLWQIVYLHVKYIYFWAIIYFCNRLFIFCIMFLYIGQIWNKKGYLLNISYAY